jgi:hypothetical protein
MEVNETRITIANVAAVYFPLDTGILKSSCDGGDIAGSRKFGLNSTTDSTFRQ